MSVSEQLSILKSAGRLSDLCLPDKKPKFNPEEYFQLRLNTVLENADSEFNKDLLSRIKSEFSDFKKAVEEIDYKSSVKNILAALDSQQKYIIVNNLASLITSFFRENLYYVDATTGERLIDIPGNELLSSRNLYKNVALFYSELSKLPEFSGYVTKLQAASNSGKGVGILKRLQDHIEHHIESTLFKELNKFAVIAQTIYDGYLNGFVVLNSKYVDELKSVLGHIKHIHSLPAPLRLGLYLNNADLYTELNASKNHLRNLESCCIDDEDIEISTLSAELIKKNSKELAEIRELTEAAFRSSVEARLFKLLKEVTADQPDQSRIAKLVKQLSQTEKEKIDIILSEFKLHIDTEPSAFSTINRLLSSGLEQEADTNQYVENIQEVHSANGDEIDYINPEPEPDLQIQEDKELLRMLIDDLGVTDEAAIEKLLSKCSIDQLETIYLQVAEGDRNLWKLLINKNSDLIDPTNDVPFSYYTSRLSDAIELCRGLEEYEVFNPHTHPEHFSDIEIMARTVNAAKMLKEVLRGIDSENDKMPVYDEVATHNNYIMTEQIDKLGINGRLCVALVLHGFWFEGSLAVSPKVCKAEYIRRNLPHQFYSINSKVMGKVLRMLVDNNVVIQVDKKRVNSAFSLQPNPAKVPEGVFRELLTMVLEQRRS